MSLKRTICPTKIARLLSESAGFALWTQFPVVGGFQVVMGTLPYDWALCRNAPFWCHGSGQGGTSDAMRVVMGVWLPLFLLKNSFCLRLQPTSIVLV